MGDSIRVLHVDDDPDHADLMATMLERGDERIAVETAGDAEEALDRLADGGFDCVVSDYEMPGSNGIEFLETVREEYPDLPFLLFTSKGGEEVASTAISAGVTEYLQKGTGTEQYEMLLNRIDNAVSQYETERELERRIDIFEKAEEIVDIGAWETDLAAGDGWWTEQVAEILGLPSGYDPGPGEGVGLFHPEDQPTLQRAFERAIEEGEPYDLELRVMDDDGSVRWVRTVADPQTEDGEVVRIRGTLQDITDRKQRQAVLKALHRAATGIQTEETVEGVCERTVEAAAEILEMDLCTVVIREGDWLVPRASSAETLPDGSRPMRIDQGIAGRTYQTGDSFIIDDAHAAGETDPAKESYRGAISVPMGDQGVFQAVSIEPNSFDADDIEFAELLLSHTENAMDRIERERELRRQNDRLEKFASIVSHDLRNPLNVAQLQLSLAEQERDAEHFDSVARAHERMETLIDDLLTLARAGQPVDGTETVALVDIVEESWQNVDTTGAELLTETGATIRADRTRLQELLENLVRNAVQHGSTASASCEENTITVTVGELDDGFSVEDDGPGIPAEIREDVFESGYSTEQDGTGFGLAIVADIAEAHDWEINITESHQGGARFEITGVQFVE